SPISVEVMPRVLGLESTPVTELAIVICRPSRIQAAPRPATIRVWKGLQLSLSNRAGIVERSGAEALAVIWNPLNEGPAAAGGPTVPLDHGKGILTMALPARHGHLPIGMKPPRAEVGVRRRHDATGSLLVVGLLDRLGHHTLELEVHL